MKIFRISLTAILVCSLAVPPGFCASEDLKKVPDPELYSSDIETYAAEKFGWEMPGEGASELSIFLKASDEGWSAFGQNFGVQRSAPPRGGAVDGREIAFSWMFLNAVLGNRFASKDETSIHFSQSWGKQKLAIFRSDKMNRSLDPAAKFRNQNLPTGIQFTANKLTVRRHP